ncbi:MAG: hypothetical protein ABIR29_00315 [Chthoniobacterales bacterium]
MIDSLDYFRIKTVHSFAELVATPFAQGVNALCWPRTLPGDFGEVVANLGAGEGVVTIEERDLVQLALSPAGRMAINGLREDLCLLREQERAPVLNCIHDYPRDEEPGPVRTDVFSLHVDSAPVAADTWLCTYFGRASEGLRNEEARRKVEIPETREKLRTYLGAEADDDGFRRRVARALLRPALRGRRGGAAVFLRGRPALADRGGMARERGAAVHPPRARHGAGSRRDCSSSADPVASRPGSDSRISALQVQEFRLTGPRDLIDSR